MDLTEQKPWRGWKTHWTVMLSGVRLHACLSVAVWPSALYMIRGTGKSHRSARGEWVCYVTEFWGWEVALTDVWRWTLALQLMTLGSGNIYWLCSEKAVDGLWVQLSPEGLSLVLIRAFWVQWWRNQKLLLHWSLQSVVFLPTLKSKLYTKCKYQLCYQIQLNIIILNGQCRFKNIL